MKENDLGRKVFHQITEVIPQNSEIRMEEERIGTISPPPKSNLWDDQIGRGAYLYPESSEQLKI